MDLAEMALQQVAMASVNTSAVSIDTLPPQRNGQASRRGRNAPGSQCGPGATYG